jgi:hypothetical protein
MTGDGLREYELELAAAEAEAAAAITRVEALRNIVEGLRVLQQPAGQTEPAMEASGEVTSGPPSHAGSPRGRDAVRGVLVDTRRAWKIPDLAAEIERRRWMPDAVNKRDAVAATVQRLVKDGEAERVGHGVYRYRIDKLPPLELGPSDEGRSAEED